jgi:hypothetical protein
LRSFSKPARVDELIGGLELTDVVELVLLDTVVAG